MESLRKGVPVLAIGIGIDLTGQFDRDPRLDAAFLLHSAANGVHPGGEPSGNHPFLALGENERG